jgi:hypothetical protein
MGLFGDDLPRSSSDIEPLEGSPAALRSCASDLRTLAGDLSPAWTACHELGLITDGTSWHGEGFNAFRGKVDKNPKTSDIDNAQSMMGSAAGTLDTLATGLEDCQGRIDWCRQRIDALGLTEGDIPEDVRPQVEAIKSDADGARADYTRHLTTAGNSFEELTDKTVYAEPPPGFFESVANFFVDVAQFGADFLVGIVEGVWEMVKGLVSIVALAFQPWKWPEAWETIKMLATYAWNDPLGFAKTMGAAIIDLDTLRENPAKWLGKLVPNILLAIATGGAGTAAVMVTRLAVFGARFARMARVMNKMAKVASKADKLRVDRVLRNPKVGVLKPRTERQVNAHNAHMGRRGDKLSTQKWTNMGYTKVAKEVTMQSHSSVRRNGDPRRARIDHVFQEPGSGPLVGVESKNGLGANLRGDQGLIYREAQTPAGVELRTDKLAGQGLPYGSSFSGDVHVDHWYSPVDAPGVGSQVAVQVGAEGAAIVGDDEPLLPPPAR